MSRETPRKRVVVAEDDEAILELVTVRLELAGYHPLQARNGHQALERARATAPDGMVLDIGLPGLDGFGVLTALQKYERKFPILVLTARHSQDDVRRAIGLGATDFLAKPFDDKMLIARIARMMGQPVNTAREWQL